jgi:Contractile injection system tape measure protein
LPSHVVDAVATPLHPGAPGGAVIANASSVHTTEESRLIDYLLSGTVTWPVRPDSPGLLATLASVARSSPTHVAVRVARLAPDAQALRAAVFRLLQLVDERDWQAVIVSAGGSTRIAAATTATEGSADVDPADTRDRRLRLVVSRLSDHERRDTTDGSPHDPDRSVSPGERPASMRTNAAMKTPHDDAPTRSDTLSRVVEYDARVSAASFEAPAVRVTHGGSEPVPEPFATAVACAGLVLLHPYLPQFFRSLEVDLRHESPPDSFAVSRAAALLHFVATELDEPFELELGFIKILLGLAPDATVSVSAGLITGRDREEAAAMLQAAIDHWGALKQTSTHALRTSFLQRSGLVRADENGWRLRVESGPFDMLLKRLPWSLALVKLPWMHTPLHCEWPTS